MGQCLKTLRRQHANLPRRRAKQRDSRFIYNEEDIPEEVRCRRRRRRKAGTHLEPTWVPAPRPLALGKPTLPGDPGPAETRPGGSFVRGRRPTPDARATDAGLPLRSWSRAPGR